MIKAVGLIGSGQPAVALARSLALKGAQVRIYDIFGESLNDAMARLEWALAAAGRPELTKNIETIRDAAGFAGADIITETEARSSDERLQVLRRIAGDADKDCVITLRGDGLALPADESFAGPERFVGMNFFPPVRENKLAEIIRAESTGDRAAETASEFARFLDKTPIICRDTPGAIVERLRRPFMLTAVALLESGKGRVNEIDSAARDCGGAAAGPFETADLLGLDSDYAVSQSIYERLGRPERLKPSALQNRLVQYGHLGKKSTAGFYLYDDGKIAGENPVLRELVPYLGISNAAKERIFAGMAAAVEQEAKLLAAEAMVSEFDIETAAKLGLGWAKGPFAIMRELDPALYAPEQHNDQWGDAL